MLAGRITSFKMAARIRLIFLLTISGTFGDEWKFDYDKKHLCVLEGTTVLINSTYTHPKRLTVTHRFWTINPVPNVEPNDLSNFTSYSGRVEYIPRQEDLPRLEDGQKQFTLKLINVKKTDEQIYYIRIITNVQIQKILGHPGVILNVTDLQLIFSKQEVTEGDSVDLSCKTTCFLAAPTFIWYKDQNVLNTTTDKVHLQKVSSEDTGRYRCAVRGYKHLQSNNRTLSVRFAPKNFSVSISPSGQIVENTSVTLNCSSVGNPPVSSCEWFKGTTSVRKGNLYTMSQVSAEDSGVYKCKCMNDVGQRYSNNVTLDVLYPPKNVSVSISPSGQIVENTSVTLSCSSDGNPVSSYEWFKGTKSVGKVNIYTMSQISAEDSGVYKCKCMNDVGHRYSNNVSLDVLYPPKKVSVSISPSGQIVDDSSVTLNCSSDGNPPVRNFTWFKESDSSAVGWGQSYRAVESGQYYCEARNKHGAVRSPAVSVTMNGFQRTAMFVGIGVCSMCVFICLGTFLWIRKKKRMGSTEERHVEQNNLYANVGVTNPNKPAADPASANQDEVLYSTVVHQRTPDSRNAVKASGSEEEELQYASIKFTHTGDEIRRSSAEHEAPIYSRVK